MRPPGAQPTTNADAPAHPTPPLRAVEVRSDGKLISCVTQSDAEFIIWKGWAEWRGTGNRRHVALTSSAPLSALGGLAGWRGKDGTRTVRADGRGQRASGQALGASKSHREHIG
jgi:hypothetical protein